jgi:hypothetical protein
LGFAQGIWPGAIGLYCDLNPLNCAPGGCQGPKCFVIPSLCAVIFVEVLILNEVFPEEEIEWDNPRGVATLEKSILKMAKARGEVP